MIVINPSTRQFIIPGADLVFGVEADSGSERKHFQCPRYVGNNVDVANSFVRINYRNANGEIDAYLIEDLTIDGDNVLFSWELHPKVTMYKGQISFVMCVTGPDAKVKWHTTMGKGQVLEGLEPDSAWIESGTEDAIAQLITMVDVQKEAVEKAGAEQVAVVKTAASTATASAVAEIESKRASSLASIPEDYTAVQNAVRGAANAIRGKVSGEAIRVDDVSPMEHYPEIWVHGKNLFDVSKIQVMPESNQSAYVREVGANHIVITTQDGYTGNGFCTIKQTLRELCPSLKVGKTYTLTATTESTSVNIYLYISQTVWLFGKPMIVTEEMLNSAVTFYGLSERDGFGTGDCTISNIQIEEGTVATEYVPYIDPATVKVRVCGKNLLPFPYFDGQQVTRGGITGTANADGSVRLVGTATENFYFRLAQVPLGSTTLISNRTDGVFYLQDCAYDAANKFSFCMVYKGETVDKTFYPQIEVGTVGTAYEPPLGAAIEVTPSVDGVVGGVHSVSPTMTLLTDAPGITIECEYNRDTNKVIEEILNKITAIGG